MEETKEKKSIRKPNFSHEEVLKLLDGVATNREMLMNKLSSEVTNKKKSAVWRFISTSVSACGVAQRTMEEVREKWGGLKKKYIGEQASMMKTGGGPAGPPNPYSDLGRDTELIQGVNGK